jgi:dipeptidyl aminopeptidase/acylaminoacyl peptidase
VLNAAPHSDRVAAVIASNGYADLVSAFELPPFFRSAPDEGVPIGQLSGWAETGQAAIGAFPAEATRYVEMSPLFSAADLRAPALLIESDLERPRMGKLFGVLYRLNREAALLTYYGEGHVLASPANLRDLHAHILDWLARYLGPPAGDAALPVAGPSLQHGGQQRGVGALAP